MTKKKAAKKTKPDSSKMTAAKKKRQDAFLKEFKICATVTHAVRAAGIGRQTHYDWLKKDEEYQVAFAEARSQPPTPLFLRPGGGRPKG